SGHSFTRTRPSFPAATVGRADVRTAASRGVAARGLLCREAASSVRHRPRGGCVMYDPDGNVTRGTAGRQCGLAVHSEAALFVKPGEEGLEQRGELSRPFERDLVAT